MYSRDPPLPFPYRSGAELFTFFRGLGLEFDANGQSRNPSVETALTAINLKALTDENMPSIEIVAIVEELLNRSYFDNTQQDRVNYQEAVDRMNKILAGYKFKIATDHQRGLCRLRLRIDYMYGSAYLLRRDGVVPFAVELSPSSVRTAANSSSLTLIPVSYRSVSSAAWTLRPVSRRRAADQADDRPRGSPAACPASSA